MDVKTF